MNVLLGDVEPGERRPEGRGVAGSGVRRPSSQQLKPDPKLEGAISRPCVFASQPGVYCGAPF